MADDGRDWTEVHVNLKGARHNIAVLLIGPNLMLELFEYDRPTNAKQSPPRIWRQMDALSWPLRWYSTKGPASNYVLDSWGNQVEFVE